MTSPPKPPKHLNKSARTKWRELAPTFQDWTQATADALTCYCAAWGRLVDAEAKLKELGTVIKSAAGFAVVSPYAAVQKDAQRQLRQWGDVLGLHKKAAAGRKEVDAGPVGELLAETHAENEAVGKLLAEYGGSNPLKPGSPHP